MFGKTSKRVIFIYLKASKNQKRKLLWNENSPEKKTTCFELVLQFLYRNLAVVCSIKVKRRLN